MKSKGRILVAMSGGIDSSVAALMLHEDGWEVIGMTMKTWDYASAGGSRKETGCCSLDTINDARSLAVKCGFPHYIIDLREEFGDKIIENFVREYIAGRTPNPCVLCNTHIKWEALLRRADLLNCEKIATGHYARIRFENGRYVISKGIDDHKDQSYVLWGVKQNNLARTIFPIGNYRKDEIRAIAIRNDYEALAKKSESYEICFIPDNDYRNFLSRKVNGLKEEVKGGKIINTDGVVIGSHRGYPFYTIGQRKGLGIASDSPLYVTEIHPETNTVVLGTKEYLKKNRMVVSDCNLIKYDHWQDDSTVLTKIRYKDAGTMSTINERNGNIEVQFHRNVSAVTPGQSAVFYEGDDVVGGGIIV